MTFRTLIVALVVLGFAAERARAQPIAPPRRPTFSTYNNIYAQSTTGSYGAYGGLLGFGGYGNGWGQGGMGGNALMQQQNLMLSQQLSSLNQNMAKFQTFLATGVNPNFPTTGHAAVFNNLGHWYTGGIGAGGMDGGFYPSRGAASNSAFGDIRNPGGIGGIGAPAQNRTAGTGFPVGGGTPR